MSFKCAESDWEGACKSCTNTSGGLGKREYY